MDTNVLVYGERGSGRTSRQLLSLLYKDGTHLFVCMSSSAVASVRDLAIHLGFQITSPRALKNRAGGEVILSSIGNNPDAFRGREISGIVFDHSIDENFVRSGFYYAWQNMRFSVEALMPPK